MDPRKCFVTASVVIALGIAGIVWFVSHQLRLPRCDEVLEVAFSRPDMSRWDEFASEIPEEVYVGLSDGTAVEKLTRSRDETENLEPTWSPDGTRIAFQSARTGEYLDASTKYEIFVTDEDGSRESRVTRVEDGVYDEQPDWSPDGRWIAFSRSIRRDADVWVMAPDGTAQRMIAGGPNDEIEPSWSPDSDRIAFLRGDELWVVDADGSGERFVTELAHGTPRWSPRGDRIVFPRGPSIYVVSAAGGEARRVEPDDPFAGHDLARPYWREDGRILFTARANELWAMRPDGSNAERLGVFEEGVGGVEPEPCRD